MASFSLARYNSHNCPKNWKVDKKIAKILKLSSSARSRILNDKEILWASKSSETSRNQRTFIAHSIVYIHSVARSNVKYDINGLPLNIYLHKAKHRTLSFCHCFSLPAIFHSIENREKIIVLVKKLGEKWKTKKIKLLALKLKEITR